MLGGLKIPQSSTARLKGQTPCACPMICGSRHGLSRVHSDSRFTVLLFLEPPRSACRFTCVPRCTGGDRCVCLRSCLGCRMKWDDSPAPCPSEWSRERSAPSSVARVCRHTPLYTKTTLCRLPLLHHGSPCTGGGARWVSLTYHVSPKIVSTSGGPALSVALSLKAQGSRAPVRG